MEIGTKLFNKVTGTYDLELVIVLFLGHFLHILTFQHRRIYIINIYFLGNIGCVILYVDVEKTFTITFRFFFVFKNVEKNTCTNKKKMQEAVSTR